MKKEEFKKFKEIIDSLEIDYYEEENEKLNKEIENIMANRPKYEGIYNFDSTVVPPKEKDKTIKRLKLEIKENKERAKKLALVLSELKSSSDKLEELAEQDLLLDSLYDLMRFRINQKFNKTDIYEENKNKYRKLYSTTIKKITTSKHKISKDMYKMIKKNAKEKAYKNEKDFLGFTHYSIGTALKYNEINMDLKRKDFYAPGSLIFNDFQNKYIKYPYSKDIAKLGVDINLVEYAIKQTEGEVNSNSLTWHGSEALEKLESIKKAYDLANVEIKGGYSKLTEISNKYNEIIELSRELWYLDTLLLAFKDTNITKTEMYLGLQELVREQENELYKMSIQADKMYEKSGLQTKVELVKKLEELHIKTVELHQQINELRNTGNDYQAGLIEQDFSKLRYEMIKILSDNPDLNNPKYNIDIEKIIKTEMELFESEIKLEKTKETKDDFEESKKVETDESKSNLNSEGFEEITTHVETPEEKRFVENVYDEEKESTNKFELDSNLQIFRTIHYQNYIKEKVLNSDLGKLSFSVYLETVAPHLTELIAIEKERESLARTIYRDYIKYYAALENKAYAKSFEDFAKENYGINNIDVPVEKEEEYKGIKK